MIPGFLISILTFPGVIVHETAHLLFCRLFGIPVYRVCYFRFGNPAGYVQHAQPRSFLQHFFISTGPFFLNSLVAIGLAIPVMLHGTLPASPRTYLLLWLAISIAMHAFPSTGDAKSLWTATRSRQTPFLVKILATPVVLVVFLIALGSIFWVDLAWGIFLILFATKWVLALLH